MKNVLLIIGCVTAIVVVLATVLIMRTKKDHFCGTCQGYGIKQCVDKPLLSNLYKEGILTEQSYLVRDKEWPTMSFDSFHHYDAQPQTSCGS